MATIATGDLDSAKLLTFEKNFLRIANQTNSKLMGCPAVVHKGIQGISNISRIDGDELVEVTSEGRNPKKHFKEVRNDNRKSVARRFTLSYLKDSYDSAVNFICDPTSDLYKNLQDAKNRTADRCIVQAATAPVIVGRPDEAGKSLTAAEDGVMTIDGTSNFGYKTVISPAITMFTNNYIDTDNVTLAISAVEEQCLRDDDNYMNALYSNNNTVDRGKITNASGFKVVTFAGTQNGVAEVDEPILTEKEGKRSNLLLAPNSIAYAFEVGCLDCTKSDAHVNSWAITIDVYVKAVRLFGKGVIECLSTI